MQKKRKKKEEMKKKRYKKKTKTTTKKKEMKKKTKKKKECDDEEEEEEEDDKCIHILMFYTQSAAMGHQGETKCIPTTRKHSDSLFNTHSTVEDGRNLVEDELAGKELGR